MKQIAIIESRGPSVGLLTTATSVSELSETFNLKIDSWVEPGLGLQSGFNVLLSSGVAVHAEDCLERPELGVSFYIDGNALISQTVEVIAQECILAFSLAGKVLWQQSSNNVGGT